MSQSSSVCGNMLDKELVQRAVLETAFAYYRKGPKIQYDSTELTTEDRESTGVCRLNSGDSPEMTGDDRSFYTVCSDWCYDVYYNAFGYQLTDSARRAFTYNMTPAPTSDPSVILKCGFYMDDVHTRDKFEFIEQCQKLWEPGDVIVIYARPEDGTEMGGHAMLFVGDYNNSGKNYILHSSGSKIDMSTGIDRIEKPGSIRLQDAYEHLFDPNTARNSPAVLEGNASLSNHNLNPDKYTEMILLRPWLAKDFPTQIPPATQTRLKYPGLDIDRSTNLSRYVSVRRSDEVTITVTLKNTSTSPMEQISVTEPIPNGGEIVSESITEGGILSKTGICWTATLSAGEEKQLSYRVKVTAHRGDTLSLPGGMVDQIPTRPLWYSVAGAAADAQIWSRITEQDLPSGCSEAAFARELYHSVLGVELQLPNRLQDFLDSLTDEIHVPNSDSPNHKMLTPKAVETLNPQAIRLTNMILPEHLCGMVMRLDNFVDSMHCCHRPAEYRAASYEPGDIFLCLGGSTKLSAADPADVTTYIYLGEDRMAVCDHEGTRISGFDETLARAIPMNVVIGLRPSLAFDVLI